LIRINGYVKKFEGQIYLKTFFEARRIMRWHYHWIILNDYLPKIVGKKIVLKLLKNQKLDDQREPFEKVNNLGNIKKINDVPVEFSIAAFRFGHSMIRDDYKINDSSSSSKLLSIKRTNQRFNDILDWRKLFTRKDGNDKDVNMSMKIDPSISSHMVNDLDVNHSNLGIVTRNLLRSWQFQLPSGQVIAEYLGLTIIRKDILEKEKFLKLIKNYKRLSNQELKDYENKKYKTKKEFLSRLKDSFPHNKEEFPDFIDNSPLWFYTLIEATCPRRRRTTRPCRWPYRGRSTNRHHREVTKIPFYINNQTGNPISSTIAKSKPPVILPWSTCSKSPAYGKERMLKKKMMSN
jgi:hypothetical protein